MRIYRKGNILAEVTVKKNAKDCYVLEEAGADHTVTLGFDILKAVPFEIDDYVVVGGIRYYIRYNESISKKETSLGYTYTIVFHDESYKLNDWTYFPNGVPERKKNFTTINGTADFIVDSVIACANKRDSGWTKGSIIVTESETFNLQDKTLMEVLQDVANVHKTELWFYGKQVNIGRREYPSGGLVLSQGEGGGLIDLKLSAVDKTKPTTAILPYGSDANLTKEYGHDFLILPGGQLSIEKNVEKYGYKDKSIQFPDIFPKGEFYVTEVVDTFTLKASGIDFDLTDHLIPGVEAIVTFQTGGLAGYDFNIAENSWNNAAKQFKIKKNGQENALQVPGDINFAVGDKFFFTGIKMPQSYIAAAEQKLYERAEAWLDKNCDKKVQVDCPCDPAEFKRREITIAVGQMVGVYNEEMDLDREIRCTRVKRYLEPDEETIPFRYEITLSDFLKPPSLKDKVEEIEKLPETIKGVEEKARDLYGRNWRDLKELADALPGMFDDFSESINPVSVNAMQIYLGSEKLQYMFVASKTSQNEIVHDYFYDKNTKVFSTPAGWIRHMTIGIDSLKPSHELGEYKHWLVSAFTSAPLLDGKARWLLIKASKKTESAEFLFSAEKLEDTADHYYFIVGFLNSEYNGTRSWATMYGWSEWTPGVMRVNKISSTDGRTFIDLLSGIVQGKFTFQSGSSGYDNITDKPDLSLYATTNFVNNVTAGLETQIDGKVETWFQAANPWNSWAGDTEHRHIGDLWYDTYNKVLYRYIGPNTNNWGRVEDRDVIKAMQDASKAQDTADGKRRVFLATPYPPYDAGDLWTNGTNLYRCITSRQTGSYYPNDWGLATNYDNTKVVIDNGIVTAGTIQLAGDAGAIMAGMTGNGTASGSIRIWAGATYENRATAPYRVRQDGGVVMDDANVTGTINAKEGTIGGFKIGQYSLDNGNLLLTAGQISFKKNNGVAIVMGGISLVAGAQIAAQFTNDFHSDHLSFGNGTALSLIVGRSRSKEAVQRWIDCSHSVGWGSRFQVESRYFGEADGLERTVINVGKLMSHTQLQSISSNANLKPMYYDDSSGLACFMY